MAGNASKKQAQSNKAALLNLYKISVPVVLLALLRTWYSPSNNSIIKFIFLHIPCLTCLYVLETTGRPQFGAADGKLNKVGVDLTQTGGLVSYMFDVIYLSLFADLGRIIFNTNKFWWLIIVLVLGYGGYKLWGLKQLVMPSLPKANGKNGAAATNAAPEKSKRQMKKEKRGDKMQVKYR